VTISQKLTQVVIIMKLLKSIQPTMSSLPVSCNP